MIDDAPVDDAAEEGDDGDDDFARMVRYINSVVDGVEADQQLQAEMDEEDE